MPEERFYSEETFVEAIHRLTAKASTCRVAVAYCGTSAYRFFPEAPASRPPDLRIVVDASDGSVRRGLTNPKGLEHLLGLTSQIRSLDGLHAKVFIFDDTTAIVGSVNLSESSITQQYQLALVTSDAAVVREIIEWFDETIWIRGEEIDGPRLISLKGLWEGEFHFPRGKKKGTLPNWRGEAPQPTLRPSDFSIGIAKEDLEKLLFEFRTNKCDYSKNGESCRGVSIGVESHYTSLGKQFHTLMKRRGVWNHDDVNAIFDLAYTNGKAAKMRKPLFTALAPNAIKESLTFLFEGGGDIYVRFEKLLDPRGHYKLDGLGEAGLIFLIHLWSPKDFPVINAPVENAFKILKVRFHRRASKRAGQGYKDRTAVIREIIRRTGLETFARVDHFLDAIGKGHIGTHKH